MTSSSSVDTYELCHHRPFGTKVSLAIREDIAGGVPSQFPHIAGGLDRWLSIGWHIHLRPLVAPSAGAHNRVPGLLDMRQHSGILQHLASGRFLEHALAVGLRVVVQSASDQSNNKDAAQRPLAAAALLFLWRGILFVLLLLRAALLLNGLGLGGK